MPARSAHAGVLALLTFASAAPRLHAQSISDAHRAALDRIEAMYAAVGRVSIRATRVHDSRTEAVYELDVAADGTFIELYPAATAPEKKRSEHAGSLRAIIAFDGTTLRQGTLTVYDEYPMADYLVQVKSCAQWAKCPWPVVPLLCRRAAAAPDASIRAEGDASVLESRAAGIMLGWRDDGAMTRLRLGDPAVSFLDVTFRDFAPGASSVPPLPRLARVETSHRSRDGTMLTTTEEYAIEHLALLGPEGAGPVMFDAKALNLNRRDRATGDVVSPDGTKLYNEKEVSAVLDAAEGRGRERPWLLALVVATAIAAAWAGWRRLRQGA
ncbi:MAG: hypothetical protein JNM07_03685 [Phycisphaerae bacterium]|nr:hypothetical protein [Phycisphaerae bacterium]